MKLSWRVLLALLIANILSFLLFLKGFFPSKQVLPGYNEELIFDSTSPKFNKIVFVVIDALRSDFLYSEDTSHFSFVHQLINENKAVPFTAFSTPPTVTLPRLKGITLGTTPNFLDAILNIADDKDQSQGLLNQDNWLYQFKNSGSGSKILNFYGDDTWLKLFPDFFNDSDGTNSFFVNDFYEVDNNVTRHLDHELTASANWDGLFLHYLGLDHIGHKTGPISNFMTDKHKELDNIIRRIYSFIESSKDQKDTLFVVMGDHGMNDIGNHGGSSKGETSAAMMLVSPKFAQLKLGLQAPLPHDNDYSYYKQINQMDLIPTLSTLFNFPIPKNNIGVFISEFLKLFDVSQHHSILLKNCGQISKLASTPSGLDSCKDLTSDEEFLKSTQEVLIESTSNYNYINLIQAIAGCIICLLLSGSYLNYFVKGKVFSTRVLAYQMFMVAYSIHFHGSSLIEEEHHIWWILSTAFIIYLYIFIGCKSHLRFVVISIAFRVIKGWSNTGQKFNNYYVFSTFLIDNPSILWILISIVYIVVGLLIYFQGSLRFCFNFEINSKTVNTLYFKNDMNNVFTFIPVSMLVSLSFTFKLLQAYLDGYKIPKWLGAYIEYTLSSFAITGFDKKAISKVLVDFSNYAFEGVIVLMISRALLGFMRGFKLGTFTDLVNLFTVFLINQTKVELVPMYILFFIIRFQVSKIIVNNKSVLLQQTDHLVIMLAVFNSLISNLTFFFMGGTNSLATVDLSNSYNGVESYEIAKVSLLTFVSNFAGPIFWSLSTLNILLESHILVFRIKEASSDLIHMKKLKFQMWNLKLLTTLVFNSVSCLNLLLSCFNLRFHLFIWTVFSPKLLYFGVWFILINILVDLGLSGIFLVVS